MDHSAHSGHEMPVHTPEPRCSMNMLFTWDWQNTCIVFKWWHLQTFHGFIISLLLVGGIAAGYEYFKHIGHTWEKNYTSTVASTNDSSIAFRKFKLKQSVLYGFQVGYSFLLMLVFMTYNGWLMIAVSVGAAVGYYFFGSREAASRSLACH